MANSVFEVLPGVKDTTVLENGVLKDAYAFTVKLGNGDVISVPIPKEDFTKENATKTIHDLAIELMSMHGLKSDITMADKPHFTSDAYGQVQMAVPEPTEENATY